MQIEEERFSRSLTCECAFRGVHVQVQGHLQVQVQCIMYTLQWAGCSVLPAKDEELAVKTYILSSEITFQSIGPLGRCFL